MDAAAVSILKGDGWQVPRRWCVLDAIWARGRWSLLMDDQAEYLRTVWLMLEAGF